MNASTLLALSVDFLTNEAFWINVGVLVATYGIFALGIQLNVGTTGIVQLRAGGVHGRGLVRDGNPRD